MYGVAPLTEWTWDLDDLGVGDGTEYVWLQFMGLKESDVTERSNQNQGGCGWQKK